MGVEHVHVPVKLVKSVPPRIVVGDGVAYSPFAETAGAVAGGLQDVADGSVLRSEQPGTVAADPRMAGMTAGQQDATRGRADCGTGVMASEPDAFVRQAVQMGRAERFLTVTAEVAVTEIVGQDIDDVGTGFGGGEPGERRHDENGDSPD